MARVTTEDCAVFVPNPFELVILAAHRCKKISAGSALLVDRDNDKNPVVALREIGDGVLSPDVIREAVISSYRQFKKVEANEEELENLLEQELESAKYITDQLFETLELDDSSEDDFELDDEDNDLFPDEAEFPEENKD